MAFVSLATAEALLSRSILTCFEQEAVEIELFFVIYVLKWENCLIEG